MALADIIAGAAQRYGIDPGALSRMAQIESAMNPNAVSPTGAKGLFQFIRSTARNYQLANPFDPAQSADAAARLYRDNAASLFKTLGRAPTAGEVYLAHQQGSAGAGKLLSNPNALARDLVGAQAIRVNGGNPNMTAGQFAQLWINKFNKTPGSVGDPSMAGPTPSPGAPAGGLADLFESLPQAQAWSPPTVVASPQNDARRIALLSTIGSNFNAV